MRMKEESSDKESAIMSISEVDKSPAIGCFDLTMHHSSSESHHISARVRFARLLNLFRSRSDTAVESKSSKPHSKSGSTKSDSRNRSVSPSPTAAPKRRFVRVVRDADADKQSTGLMNNNPHVICRYSQSFLQEHYSQEDNSNKPLPYVTSGHTILKKSSTDPTPSCGEHSPPSGKHATFKELVEIIEFSGQETVETGALVSHEARLHDNEVASSDSSSEPGFFLRHDSLSSETENTAEEENNELQSKPDEGDDNDEDVVAKVPPVDLDRMDGIMRNIFSSVANVHESSPEPPKIRRVELAELCGIEVAKTSTTS